MINGLRTMQKDFEELLEATKKEKQEVKKSIPKLEKLKIQNEEMGIAVEGFTEKIENATTQLEGYNKEIVKIKKVIHRLGVCINILQGEEVEEVATEIIDDEE